MSSSTPGIQRFAVPDGNIAALHATLHERATVQHIGDQEKRPDASPLQFGIAVVKNRVEFGLTVEAFPDTFLSVFEACSAKDRPNCCTVVSLKPSTSPAPVHVETDLFEPELYFLALRQACQIEVVAGKPNTTNNSHESTVTAAAEGREAFALPCNTLVRIDRSQLRLQHKQIGPTFRYQLKVQHTKDASPQASTAVTGVHTLAVVLVFRNFPVLKQLQQLLAEQQAGVTWSKKRFKKEVRSLLRQYRTENARLRKTQLATKRRLGHDDDNKSQSAKSHPLPSHLTTANTASGDAAPLPQVRQSGNCELNHSKRYGLMMALSCSFAG